MLVFLSPLETCYRVCSAGSLGGFDSVPYLSALTMALLWVVYSIPSITHGAICHDMHVTKCGATFRATAGGHQHPQPPAKGVRLRQLRHRGEDATEEEGARGTERSVSPHSTSARSTREPPC